MGLDPRLIAESQTSCTSIEHALAPIRFWCLVNEAGTASAAPAAASRLDPDGWLVRIDTKIGPARMIETSGNARRNNEPAKPDTAGNLREPSASSRLAAATPLTLRPFG